MTNNSQREELLPCPFCGGKAILTDHGEGSGGWFVTCENGGFSDGYKPSKCSVIITGGLVPFTNYKNKSDHHIAHCHNAVKIWNTRTPIEKPCPDKKMDSLFTRVFNAITRICNEAVEGSSLNKLLVSQRSTLTNKVLEVINELIKAEGVNQGLVDENRKLRKALMDIAANPYAMSEDVNRAKQALHNTPAIAGGISYTREELLDIIEYNRYGDKPDTLLDALQAANIINIKE